MVSCSNLGYTSQISLIGILESPFLGLLDGTILVLLPVVSNFLVKWIIQVWKWHQGLDREEDWSNLEGWWPLVLEDIKANSTELVNVWVVDLGSEQNLWWDHWVLIRQEEFAIEDTSFVWSFSWTSNLDIEMSCILLVWLGVDSDDWVLSESLSFL